MSKNVPFISINPLTNFVGATDSRKIRIIKEQKTVDTNKSFWYNTIKSSLPKYVKSRFDSKILEESINHLHELDQSTDNKRNNVLNSIIAIQLFKNMNFTKRFPDVRCHFLDKLETKDYLIKGVIVRVTPDVVFTWSENGKKNIGAIKFHFGKSKELDARTGRLRSALVCDFLHKSFAKEDEIVNPNYCFCIDVFHEKTFTAPHVIDAEMQLIYETCAEISKLWDIVD